MTYTSYAEGFGNQLLEAFWAKLLPVVFEYPVFKSDIKQEGYEYISLGDKMRARNGFYFVDKTKLSNSAKLTAQYLKNKILYKRLVDKNFLLAEKYHDIRLLKEKLSNLTSNILK